MKHQLTKVLVGSRLHGLYNEKSDYDYRGIHISPLKEVLSPFKKNKNTHWIEGNTDDTSYELAEFCRMAAKGNATILEVFFSNEIIEDSDTAAEMRENWIKFMDTDQFVMASRGYAHNQLNKMALFDDIGQEGQHRTNKFMIAYIRVLWQCAVFLETGQFKCQIDEPDVKAFLLELKNDFNREKHVPIATEYFATLQARASLAWKDTEYRYKPDHQWIEDFVHRSYLKTEVAR